MVVFPQLCDRTGGMASAETEVQAGKIERKKRLVTALRKIRFMIDFASLCKL